MVSLEIFDLILMKNEVGGGIIRESDSEKEENKRNLSTSIQSAS